MSLDEEKRNLERKALHDQDAIAKIQAVNDRRGLSADDAAYLARYLAICEAYIKSTEDLDSMRYEDEADEAREKARSNANDLLKALNEAYKLKVGSETLKKRLIVVDAHEQGIDTGKAWSSSSC